MLPKSIRVVLVAAAFAGLMGGCSSNNSGGDAGTSDEGTSHDASTPDADSGGMDSGTTSDSGGSDAGTMSDVILGRVDADGVLACHVSGTPASLGSCVKPIPPDDAGAGVACNPVTNDGCQEGEACDWKEDADGNVVGFVCYPPPRDVQLCQACDPTRGVYCGGGMTCIGVNDTQGACARYCCNDMDCVLGGRCALRSDNGAQYFIPIAPNLGICVPQ